MPKKEHRLLHYKRGTHNFKGKFNMISMKNPKYLLILKLKEFLDINKLFNNLPHII